MQCPHFDAARCRSCTLLGQPYAEQLAAKQKHCQDLIGERADLQWTPRVGLSEQGEDGGERHRAEPRSGHTRRRGPRRRPGRLRPAISGPCHHCDRVERDCSTCFRRLRTTRCWRCWRGP